MTSPCLTVAIAFHDDEAHLGAAIRSVLAQTERDFELLLIDDGSSDRSVAVARSFLGDRRVQLFADGRRRHLGARLNEALSRARGALFARMDGDDVCHPTRLARQLVRLEADPALSAIGSWAALVDENEAAFGVIEASTRAVTAHSLLTRGLIPHATMVARTAWLRERGYDEAIAHAEDRDLWCRVGLSSSVGVIDEVLYVVRVLTRQRTFLPDYLNGQRDLRRILLRYGPRFVGRVETARLVASSLAKASAMRVAHAVGEAERVVRRRGRDVTDAEHDRVREAFAAALQTP